MHNKSFAVLGDQWKLSAIKLLSISYLLKGSLADTIVNDAQPLFVVLKLLKHSRPAGIGTRHLVSHCTLQDGTVQCALFVNVKLQHE